MLEGGLNLYAYAGGDPVNFTDSLGATPVPTAVTNANTQSTSYTTQGGGGHGLGGQPNRLVGGLGSSEGGNDFTALTGFRAPGPSPAPEDVSTFTAGGPASVGAAGIGKLIGTLFQKARKFFGFGASGASRLSLLGRVRAATQSADPAIRLEGQVARRFRDSLTGFQRSVSSGGRTIGQIDVETNKAIIEVTTGVGRGKLAQVQRLLTNRVINPSGKPVIVFGPNVSAGRAAGIENIGGRVVRNLDELQSVVGGF